MALYPKRSMIPPGGYKYEESHQGIKVEILGDDVENLALKIQKFREINGIPIGNPLQDVVDKICVAHPHFCAESEPAFTPPKNPNAKRHISNRCSEWLARLWRLKKIFVPENEANRRAEICAQCPRNVDYRSGACGSCLESAERLAYVWLAGKTTPHDATLGACKVLGQFNKIAVHARELPPFDPETELPVKCWRK